jgi:hypothetical protein
MMYIQCPEDIFKFVGVKGVFALRMILLWRCGTVEAVAIDRGLARLGLRLGPLPSSQSDDAIGCEIIS